LPFDFPSDLRWPLTLCKRGRTAIATLSLGESPAWAQLERFSPVFRKLWSKAHERHDLCGGRGESMNRALAGLPARRAWRMMDSHGYSARHTPGPAWTCHSVGTSSTRCTQQKVGAHGPHTYRLRGLGRRVDVFVGLLFVAARLVLSRPLPSRL